MVVVSAPAVNNICESFTHNPLTRSQGEPISLSLILIHKEFIAKDNSSTTSNEGSMAARASPCEINSMTYTNISHSHH